MKLGTTARLVQPVIEGKVVDVEWDKEKDQKRIKLAWFDGDDVQERWFLESELEVVKGGGSEKQTITKDDIAQVDSADLVGGDNESA